MTLTIAALQYFIILAITLEIVGIIYVAVLLRKQRGAIKFTVAYMAGMGIILGNFYAFVSFGTIEITTEIESFILTSRVTLFFAFMFAISAIIFYISYVINPQRNTAFNGSLVMNHMALLAFSASVASGMLDIPDKLPFPINDILNIAFSAFFATIISKLLSREKPKSGTI